MRHIFYGMAGFFSHNGLYLCLASPVSFSSSKSWSAFSTHNKRYGLSALGTSGIPCQLSSRPAPSPTCSPLTWAATIANRLRAQSEQQDRLGWSSSWLSAKLGSPALPSHLSPQFRSVRSCPLSWCWPSYWPPSLFKLIQCTKQAAVKSGGQNQVKFPMPQPVQGQGTRTWARVPEVGKRHNPCGNGKELARLSQQPEELLYSEGVSAIRPLFGAPQAAETAQGPSTQNLLTPWHLFPFHSWCFTSNLDDKSPVLDPVLHSL